jgi:hypothetical protein
VVPEGVFSVSRVPGRGRQGVCGPDAPVFAGYARAGRQPARPGAPSLRAIGVKYRHLWPAMMMSAIPGYPRRVWEREHPLRRVRAEVLSAAGPDC